MDRRPHRTAAALAVCASAIAVIASGTTTAALAEEPILPVATEVPAGSYTLDRAHASLIFRVDHLSFSWFTARFTRFDATLDLDPEDPAASLLTVTVDPASIETDYPDPESYDFNADLRGANWLDTAQFPAVTFRSTEIVLIAPDAAQVTGDLTLHGVTAPVTLDVTFNGGYASHPLDPTGSRIGFSAHGALSRTAFGMGFGVPEPGSTMGVGDEVAFIVEAEFLRPKQADE